MAFGGQQPDLGALALQQRVGGNRGAVNDPIGSGQQGGEVQSQGSRHLGQAVHDAHGLIGRRGGDLAQGDLAGIVDCNQIGEGAANVNTYTIHTCFAAYVFAIGCVGLVRRRAV